MAAKLNRHVEITLKATSDCFSVSDIEAFLESVPSNAKIHVKDASSYPGEYGMTPATITASWDES